MALEGNAGDGEAIVNQQWHAKHTMPRRANLDERIGWHVQHAKHCGCRPIPPKLAQEIGRREEEKGPGVRR